jgi:hypothetical protein
MTRRHVCPPRCHRCPDLNGDVMPMCWGSVDRNDLVRCHCPREHTRTAFGNLEARVAALEEALERLLAQDVSRPAPEVIPHALPD